MTITQNISIEQSNPYRKIKVSAAENPSNVKFSNILLDTGSEYNLIPISHAVLHNTNLIPCKTHNFKGAFNNQSKMKIKARYKALLNIEFTLANDNTKQLRNIEFLVVESQCEFSLILGFRSMKKHNIIVGSQTGIIENNTFLAFQTTAWIELHSHGVDRKTSKRIYYIDAPYPKLMILPNGKTTNSKVLHTKWLKIPEHENIHGSTCKVLEWNKSDQELAKEFTDIIYNIRTDLNNKAPSSIDIEKIKFGTVINENQKQQIIELIIRYKNIFSRHAYDLGTIPSDVPGAEYEVNLSTETPQPAKNIRLPQIARQQVTEEIEKLLKAGIIEEDPTIETITSTFIPIPKKDAESGIRIVQDLRAQNNVINESNYTLPNIEQLLTKMAGHKYYVQLDLTKGYFGIRLRKNYQKFFTCQCPTTHRTFKYKRLPMGAKTSATCFQRIMNSLIFRHISQNKFSNFIDDTIIYSNDFTDLLQTLELVFKQFDKFQLKLNLKKCAFFENQIIAFGYLISSDGIKSDPQRITAFDNILIPNTKKQLSQNLGSFNYYRRLIPNYATITAPLYNLLKTKQTKIVFDETHINQWNKLINAFKNSITLNKPDFNKIFIVTTDASSLGLGGILRQENDINGVEDIIISTYSYKFTDTQIYWSAEVKELYAVFRCLVAFREFVYGRKFRIISDSRLVVLLLTAKLSQVNIYGSVNPAYRFLNYISEFDFTIKHSSGEEPSFLMTDLLSRNNIPMENKVISLGRNTRDQLVYIKDVISGKYDALNDKNIIHLTNVTIATPQTELWEILKLAQNDSKIIQEKISNLNNKTIITPFQVTNNTLYKNKHIVVPPHYELRCLEMMHDHGESAVKLIKKIHEYKLWFFNSYKTVHHFIKSCETCQSVSPQGGKKYHDCTTNLLNDINQSMAIDLFKFGPTTAVLVTVDEYSGYTNFKILKNETSEEIASALIKIILDNGIPARIRSDNAANLNSRAFNIVYDLIGCHHVCSIPRNSFGNSRAEEIVKKYQTELRILQPNKNGEDLEFALTLSAFKINTRKKKGFEASPFEITYGRTNNVAKQLPEWSSETIKTLPERMQNLYHTLDKIRKEIWNKQLGHLHKIQQQVEDPSHNFKIGQIVKIKNLRKPGEFKKLFKPYSTHNYRILEILDFANSLLVERIQKDKHIRPFRTRVHFRLAKVVEKRRNEKEQDIQTDFNQTIQNKVQSNANELECIRDEPQVENNYNLRKRKPINYRE